MKENKPLEVTSVGTAGEPDFNRSFDRAYLTEAEVITSFSRLEQRYFALKTESLRLGKRRWVYRAVCNQATTESAVQTGWVEACVPLSVIKPNSTQWLVVIAENDHPAVELNPNPVENHYSLVARVQTSPRDRAEGLPAQFGFTSQLGAEDAPVLAELWSAFGWTTSGVKEFIDSYRNNSGVWFSGVRDMSQDGQLVSAATAELLAFGDLEFIETTEYSTNPRYEGQGLCTANIAHLHAQILGQTRNKGGQVPLIAAEYNLSTRSDIVGSKVGTVIPPKIQLHQAGQLVDQILKHNVAVFDGREPFAVSPTLEMRWPSLATPFLRHFALGVLPVESINKYYAPDDIDSIQSRSIDR